MMGAKNLKNRRKSIRQGKRLDGIVGKGGAGACATDGGRWMDPQTGRRGGSKGGKIKTNNSNTKEGGGNRRGGGDATLPVFNPSNIGTIRRRPKKRTQPSMERAPDYRGMSGRRKKGYEPSRLWRVQSSVLDVQPKGRVSEGRRRGIPLQGVQGEKGNNSQYGRGGHSKRLKNRGTRLGGNCPVEGVA